MFNDAPPAVPTGLFPCRRWNTCTWSVMHNDKLGIGQYLRSMPLVMLLPFASVLVLFISPVCVIVMFVLIFQAVVAMRM